MTSAHEEKPDPPLPPPLSLISRIRKEIPTPLALTLLACLTYLTILLAIPVVHFFRGPPFHSTSYSGNHTNHWDLDLDSELDTYKIEAVRPFKRYHLGYGEVACWQNGGLWVKSLEPLEMKAIGLNRFQDNERSLNKTEEDAFCAVLRTYGADFYALPPRWLPSVVWSNSIHSTVGPDITVSLRTCFPGDGSVWLLDPEKTGYPNMGLGNTVTMAERCSVFERMGAKFCESLRDPNCPETNVLVDKIEYWDHEGNYGVERTYFLPGGQVVGEYGELETLKAQLGDDWQVLQHLIPDKYREAFGLEPR